ncbi:MAG: hypothetical protein QOE98_2021 [Gaiellaceae bacterium]|jgi:hypothetical protein|nr:hypothetical protein [Gaiellaceae bacterium]
MAHNVAAQLDELHAERRAARRRAISYAVGIGPVLAANLLGLLSVRAGVVADAAAIAASLWWLAIEHQAAERRRELLDDLIIHGWVNVAPDDVREREVELLSPRHRNLLARALENQLLETPTLAHQRLAVLLELRRQSERLRGLARRLRDDPIDPRGVVMIKKMLTDGTSPIHNGPSDAIEPALERVERALDRAA